MRTTLLTVLLTATFAAAQTAPPPQNAPAADRATYQQAHNSYDAQADPRYGAARLWIDAIIDPAKTREVLMLALEACALNPDVPPFNPGVLQT